MAVLIGSDIPAIQPRHIAVAFQRLGAADAVFGPALDGGYWLVGLNRRRPVFPFKNVRWSTRHALEDSVANLGARRVAFAARLMDVDDGESWKRHQRARAW